ncbi:MAG: C_GCAxxG_C_C family protein [Bacteroidales bacterium]|nr:C_GCAxxG_C_C family protein [Bacteroidales bacterium]
METIHRINRSKDYFNSGFGCAESVLKSVAEYTGVKSELIPRIATGFCGGIAHTNGMCGAVTGAVMALNLVYGRNHAGESKEKNYQAIQSFLNNFREKFGDISCPGLTGVDLSTEAGHNLYSKRNLHSKCTEYVEEATRLVLELI